MSTKGTQKAWRAREKASLTRADSTDCSGSTTRSAHLLLIAVLLVAFFFRVRDLGHTPLGAHYDESANAILAGEIAQGARPIFIRAYTGKEVGYFYLVAGLIRAIGHPLIAIRLTSAFIGVLSVALTYRTARELFAREPFAHRGPRYGVWVGLLAAAIQAVNLWAIAVSRLGFRAVLQPPLQALTVLFVARALRDDRPRAAPRSVGALNWALAGVWCGLSAYTYLAIRAFPILLGLLFLWVVAFVPARGPTRWRHPALRGRLRRVWQIALFAGTAAIVFFPLGLFYVRNPEFFATRMGQVSVFSEEVGGGDPWGALWHATRVSFGMFTVRGDMNWRFNVAGAPVFWPPLGLFFVLGVAVGLWRLVRLGGRGPGHRDAPPTAEVEASPTAVDAASPCRGSASSPYKSTYWLLLLWLPVMLLPSILGGGDVEVSLSLRAIGVMPALYYWPALGLAESALALRRLLARRFSPRVGRTVTICALALLLVATGAHTYDQCFHVWGPSVPGYYVASGYLVEAADYLNANLPSDADVYVSAEHYRHPTMALLADRYADIRWLIGPDVRVYPTMGERETWYLFTHEAMPPREALDGTFGPPSVERLAPDGQLAFLAYHFAPGEVPVPQPEHPRADAPSAANLGHTLAYLGYDLNAPLVSGGVLDVTLYWKVLSEVDRDDWTIFAHLVDERGFQWGGETFFTYPSGQWRQGEVLAFRTAFPTWAGAPPGAYALAVGAFSPSLDARLPVLNTAGQMAGTTVEVGPLTLARASSLPEALPPIQQPLEARYGKGLTLRGSDRDRSDLRPGETLALSLYWLLEAEAPELRSVSLWLEGDAPSGGARRVALWEGDPAQGRYPFASWRPPEFVRDRYALRLPLDTLAGDYDLRLAVLDDKGRTTQVVTTNEDAVRNSDILPAAGSRRFLSLGTIHVHASDRLWEPPPFSHPVGARLGDVVELLGYDLDLPGEGRTIRPGETLRLTLIWRCLREMDVSYTVFTHLLDGGSDGAWQIRGQQDNPPVHGSYPTTLWVPGEVVADAYDIALQPDAPPGTYVVEVGMYDPATMLRLPVLDPTGASGDRVLLGIGGLGD